MFKHGLLLLILFAAPLPLIAALRPALADESDAVPFELLPSATKIDRSASLYFKHWPQGRPGLFKLRDDLILAIPPQYQQFWEPGLVVRAPAPMADIPLVSNVGFQFFMPDFSGYTPQNYEKRFDEDRVDVVEIQSADPKEMQPGAPGEYPPNMIKRLLGPILDPTHYKDMYGLRCYRWRPIAGEGNRITCYGRRDDVTGEDIVFWAETPPYESWIKFPLMQAQYFSPRDGGIRLVWRTNVKNLSRWHDIDAQIWKFIHAWNVASSYVPNRSAK